MIGQIRKPLKLHRIPAEDAGIFLMNDTYKNYDKYGIIILFEAQLYVRRVKSRMGHPLQLV